MFLSITTIAFYVLVAAALLVLPGLALLCVSVIPRKLDPLSRLVVAPGLTIAIAVLIFTWCDLVHLKPGPALPWILIVGSVLILILVRPPGPRLPRRTWFNFQAMVPAAALATVVLAYLALRFRATWGWCVPPGVDTEQHTMIVQLLLEHGGLFQSWAPYSEAETFTYHFGFHAITATFGWLPGLPGWSSVFIMGRVIGAAAAVSLFAMVRLWTRSPWGGVFAA